MFVYQRLLDRTKSIPNQSALDQLCSPRLPNHCCLALAVTSSGLLNSFFPNNQSQFFRDKLHKGFSNTFKRIVNMEAQAFDSFLLLESFLLGLDSALAPPPWPSRTTWTNEGIQQLNEGNQQGNLRQPALSSGKPKRWLIARFRSLSAPSQRPDKNLSECA